MPCVTRRTENRKVALLRECWHGEKLHARRGRVHGVQENLAFGGQIFSQNGVLLGFPARRD